ncbi:helicase-exonuclease AddAB subunit AddB [Cytobacillus sp. FSL K6-0129]|uniref:helicase-exonuclease AddAB subunit AddB n=1 Tax=Cytobacillus sp. FSL K6-0129 TaxID=2921421 RepID=UPI0030F5145D
MTVKMLIGRSQTGKTEKMVSEIKQLMKENPEGSPIIYIVPEQMTFQSEYKLASSKGLGGMIRTQVFSITRLAWRVLQETGGISRYHLSSIGTNMLIRKIIEEQKDELKIFQNAADKNGFIQQMESMLTEFKRYCVNPTELQMRIAQLQQNDHEKKVLAEKLHDLELIYSKFEAGILDKYLDSEDYLQLLAEKANESVYLQKATVYIDGFHSFTPQEYRVIEALIRHCPNMTIALTLDQPFDNEPPDALHLFRQTGETYQTILEIAKQQKHQVEYELLSQVPTNKHESLRHFEANFEVRPTIPFSGEARVMIAHAMNRRAEIEGIARKVRALVRDEGLRYKDITVLMRNGHEYHDLITTVFNDYEIPLFIDRKKSMLHHPVVEFIRSSLEVLMSNWRYEPVFRTIKTEMIFPLNYSSSLLREKMDRLENYVLSYGIQGSKWTKKERWKYRRIRGLEMTNTGQTDAERDIEEEVNQLRDIVAAPLLRLSRRMKKAETGREYAEALYLYLEETDIPAKIEKLQIETEERGELVRSREHNQAWNAVVELLDEYVEMLGSEQMTTERFATILDAGIEALQFSIVPPAMDQVIAADMERSRVADMKAAFIIGLNEGVLPAKFPEEGVLADDDREQLLSLGMKVAPSTKTRLLDEEFLAYKAFVTPSDYLFVSYPMANEEGKALIPSPFIKRIQDQFVQIKEEYLMSDPAELNEEGQIDYISHINTALTFLTSQLQLQKRNYAIYDMWWDTYNIYLQKSGWQDITNKVLASLHYENRTEQLDEEISKALYGETIRASVSRMELFHSCPFSHYAQYGLRLRERQVFRLEAPDIGELFHAALKYITETVMHKDLQWSDMTREQCELLAKEAVELLAPKLQHEILLSSNRYFYIKRKLEQIISRASFIMGEHAKASGFTPVGLEMSFGPSGDWPSLSFPLKNGSMMELVGRIDRVDQAKGEKTGSYLRIIDYKSSEKDVNINEVYYGLSLQMLTYLDIVIAHSEELIGMKADPAGVLYFHVHNPMINSSKMLGLDEIEKEILKKFKMKGLLLGEENVVRLMDKSLTTGDSPIISAGFNKDGSLSKRSKVADKAEFNYLRQFVRSKYIKTGNQMTGGQVEISPYKLKERTPCTFCSFKSICQFDESLETNTFRLLDEKPRDEVLTRIREEAEKDA